MAAGTSGPAVKPTAVQPLPQQVPQQVQQPSQPSEPAAPPTGFYTGIRNDNPP